MFYIFFTLNLLPSIGFAGISQDILDEVHRSYGARFNSQGIHIASDQQVEQFSAFQEECIARLKKMGAVGTSFVVSNDAIEDVVVRVSVVQEPDGQFAGVLIERNKYDHPSARSLLRLFNFPILKTGMVVFSYGSRPIASIKAKDNLSADRGGDFQISFPLDFNQNKFGSAELKLVKNIRGQHQFYKTDLSAFTRLHFSVWYSLLSQNFGVKEVFFK